MVIGDDIGPAMTGWSRKAGRGASRLSRVGPVPDARLARRIRRTVGPGITMLFVWRVWRDVRAAGGYTIAEDESTAVVYGMPAAAVRLDAVSESLPLPAIAPRLVELVALAAGGR